MKIPCLLRIYAVVIKITVGAPYIGGIEGCCLD